MQTAEQKPASGAEKEQASLGVGVERDVLRPSGSADDFAGFGIGGWGLHPRTFDYLSR